MRSHSHLSYASLNSYSQVKAEAEGRILQERKNHDLILENKRLEAKEFRTTVLEGLKLAGKADDGLTQRVYNFE
jgi:hypothetical protein